MAGILHTHVSRMQSADESNNTIDTLIERAQALADELAQRPNLGTKTAPQRELERCAEIGLLVAPLPTSVGGLGLGIEKGTQGALMRVLAILGSADLALGRLYEGHVNGLLLVERFGTMEQMKELADDCRAGMLSGVWNTGRPEPLKLCPTDGLYRFEGVKTFATGATFVHRPVVSAEIPGRGWQMTLPQMETLGALIDRNSWHPLGMESTESFGVDFTGGLVCESQLLGSPGDFYRDPMFRGGAIRFAAVQAGAILRLHSMFADWLDTTERGNDPYQIARLGEIAIAAQEAVLWVEKAAAVAEQSFRRTEKAHVERMIECANMTRIAIERQATHVMQLVISGVGARGLLQPLGFERVLRDLTMYLRQPAPDQTLADVGRMSFEKAHRLTNGAAHGFWSDGIKLESLPPKYFRWIYERSRDPWDFETSTYEHNKYAATIASLPRERYQRGLEIGCSIGVLTYSLGSRCDYLLSVDVSEKALRQAIERCMALSQVTFACMEIPKQMPEDQFELLVVSEVAYYWQRDDLEKAVSKLAALHLKGGHLVLVHLTEPVPDYPLTGDEVHDYWVARPEWKRVHQGRHDRFRLDVLERI